MHRTLVRFVGCALLIGATWAPAFGHELGRSYVFLNVGDSAVGGALEVPLPELSSLLQLDLRRDSLGYILNESDIERIEDYLAKNFAIYRGDKRLTIEFGDVTMRRIEVTEFAVIGFSLPELIEPPDELTIDLSVLFDYDPDHRGLVVVRNYWKVGAMESEDVALIFGPGDTRQVLDLSSASAWLGFVGFVHHGIWHIWIGIDHILFLIALILPAVVRREEKSWAPVGDFKPALIYVAKVVTIFTVAHSITLALAALNVLRPPARVVEAVIAGSIAVAALDILIPVFKRRIWVVVFVFGLFHGFGFANVLDNTGLHGWSLVVTLFGFNVGVELGQLAIVVLSLPALYLVRNVRVYHRYLMPAAAVVLVLVGMEWFAERAFDFNVPIKSIAKQIAEVVQGGVR